MVNGFNLPKEMGEAVLGVMKELKSLAKTGRNEHGRYNFAPVDDFYDAVHELLPKYGLLPTSSEIKSKLVPMETATYDAKGNVTARKASIWIKSTWVFWLSHNGVTSEGYQRIVWVPTAGPQTAGIVQSYASKNFMRDLFKIRTGEYELDDMVPEPHGVPVENVATVKEKTNSYSPKTGEVHTSTATQSKDSRAIAGDYKKKLLSNELKYEDTVNIHNDIDSSATKGEINETQKKALVSILHAREMIFTAKTLETVEAARQAVDSVDSVFKKDGELQEFLKIKEAEVAATTVA